MLKGWERDRDGDGSENELTVGMGMGTDPGMVIGKGWALGIEVEIGRSHSGSMLAHCGKGHPCNGLSHCEGQCLEGSMGLQHPTGCYSIPQDVTASQANESPVLYSQGCSPVKNWCHVGVPCGNLGSLPARTRCEAVLGSAFTE